MSSYFGTVHHYIDDNAHEDKYDECEDQRKQSIQSQELTSINSKDSSVNIEFYGSINLKIPNKFRAMNKCDILIFFFIFWNVYSSRKLLFPFSKEFATYYNVSIDTFSYVLSAYDLGGFCSIFLTLFPSFNNIQINLMLFLLIISVSIFYIILSFSNVFITLFIIRMMVGFIYTIIQAQIRGILSTFLKSNKNDTESNKLAFGVIATECAWWSSTISWVFVGIILNRFTVDYVWYYVSICALIGAISCYLLPRCTVSQAITMKNNVSQQINYNNINTVWKHYHIYFCFMTFFCVAFGYNAYLATFGAWITEEYHLNPEHLGFSTLVITASECTGFVSIAIMQKYKIKNINISIIANIGGVLSILCWFIILKLNIYTQFIIWFIVFIYTVFFEHVYLSLIVVNLELAPKGLESKIALFFGIINRAATVTGIIIGPHIVKWYNFMFLIQLILVIQCCASISICITNWYWNKYKQRSAI